MKKLALLLLLAGMVPVANVTAADQQEDDEELVAGSLDTGEENDEELVAGSLDADDDNIDEMSDSGCSE